ncbi:hypothetical protein G4B88_026590 [Cannabis sativa]|uniref:Potassium transporter n=1 Tax=Cannabis sativa TaxID=3483 RepID=A0A7J6GQZ2_CANSA|nr:hypothetical protein G4B88_026590 [Cannabis sativa]
MDPQLSPTTFVQQFKTETWRHTLLFSFQSLGVIYGQLSSAPLYVFGTVHQKEFVSEETAYGLFSFIFWTMTIISLLKYALLVLRADDDGEGGTFALYSILCRHAKVGLLPNDTSANEVMQYEEENPFKAKVESRARRAIAKHKSSHYLMLFLALFGACMAIGDGYYQLQQVSEDQCLQSHFRLQNINRRESRKHVPVPTACAILVCLFMLQHYGTRKIGFIFAPIVIIWLLFISGVGTYNIIRWNPHIFYAISPTYMYRFVVDARAKGWRSLGSIILCVAGSEAMFAGLGHFSKKSIKITFVCLIYPVLVLSYAGQAAYISKNYTVDGFNHLSESVPRRYLQHKYLRNSLKILDITGHFRHVFVVLSLFASAVGSQATITASFSIINQCLALGCFPRVKVIHTSDKIHGQVYIPDINWLLMVLSLSATLGFHDIVKIGSATGLAVVSGMLVTTCLMSLVIALYWENNLIESVCFLIFFGFVEAMYVSACMLNMHKGAWFLVVLFLLSFTVMLSWHYGTLKKYEFDLENKVSIEWLTDLSPGLGVSRVPGIGFIYTDIVTGIPAFFSHFVTNLPAFHQVLIFVSFKSLPVPCVHPSKRYLIGRVGHRDYKIYRCVVRCGYHDNSRDSDDFEEEIIRTIGEFISLEENDFESLTSPEGRMIVVGKPTSDGNALVPRIDSHSFVSPESPPIFTNNENQRSPIAETSVVKKRKKVRFMLPPNSPKMRVCVREELQELVDARESGTAYFLGQSHLRVRNGSNFLKRFLIMTYTFCDKNSREPPVALNIPHAALVEVGMVYTI